jgi:hypothetical protein
MPMHLTVDPSCPCEALQAYTKYQRPTTFSIAKDPSSDSYPTISAIHMTHLIRPTPSRHLTTPQTSTPPRCLLQYPANLQPTANLNHVDIISSLDARICCGRPRLDQTTHPPHSHPHQHHIEQSRIESTNCRSIEENTMGGPNTREPQGPAVLQV